jgi:hypothetical protein
MFPRMGRVGGPGGRRDSRRPERRRRKRMYVNRRKGLHFRVSWTSIVLKGSVRLRGVDIGVDGDGLWGGHCYMEGFVGNEWNVESH